MSTDQAVTDPFSFSRSLYVASVQLGALVVMLIAPLGLTVSC